MRVYQDRGDWWVDYRTKGRGGRKKIGKSKRKALEVMAKLQSEMLDREWFPSRYTSGKSFGLLLEKFWTLHGKGTERQELELPAQRDCRAIRHKREEDSSATSRALYNEILITVVPRLPIESSLTSSWFSTAPNGGGISTATTPPPA